MSQQQTKSVNALDKVDPVWTRIRREAEAVVRQEPELSSFIYSSVLHHDRLEQVVVHRIAERLDHPDVSGELIRQAYQGARPCFRALRRCGMLYSGSAGRLKHASPWRCRFSEVVTPIMDRPLHSLYSKTRPRLTASRGSLSSTTRRIPLSSSVTCLLCGRLKR